VFLLRRAARIYPLYAAVTVALLALILRHAGPGFDWGGVPLLVLLNMTLLEAWGFGVPIVGPSWSISTEFGAYLLFPVLALIGLSGRPWKAVVLTLLGVTGVVIVASLPTPDHLTGARQGPLDVFWDGTPWQLVRCVAEFSLGLVAYRVWPALRGFCQSSIVGLLVAALVLGLLLLPGTDIALALLTPLLILTLASGHTPVVAALASPPMLWLGRLSYAIYLLHTPMISPVMREGGRLAGRLVAPEWVPAFTELFFVAVVLAAANMCFLVIEKPGRTVIRRLEAFWFPREQAAR
jgi:peptidoglycan/LPS O-acetylase OafA/YrhL